MELLGVTIKNRYKVYDHIGAGAVANVYLTRDLDSNRIAALKVIHPHLLGNGRFLERFGREARIMQQFRSDYIVEIWDCGVEQDVNFIVLEFVQGFSLAHVIKQRGALPWQEALDLARQVASGLQEAEALQIVHRDVKPANILVDYRGRAKLADFGIAQSLVHTGTTQTGVLGTPTYISPEQANGEEVDIRSDIYSLGATIFEMLTGDTLYAGDSPIAVVMKHLRAPIPKPSERQEDVPASVDEIVIRCLAKKVGDRYRPHELITTLNMLIGQKPAASAPSKWYQEIASTSESSPAALVGSPAFLISAAGARYALSRQGSGLVGRRSGDSNPEVDLSSEPGSQYVSRRHAIIRYDGQRWLVRCHPKASNATVVNGKALRPAETMALADRDMLQFGEVALTFRLGRA
ncbi:MAG: FHA domain-containing protein [Chloroflexi bacterium]|nr:FHA domain-containing protein [Chloroflexota bacterium]